MSTSSVSSSTSGTSQTGYLLSQLGAGSTMQITGLASGLNTNQIIQEEMAIYQQPVTNLQNQQSGVTAMNTKLTSIQSELQTLASDAQALSGSSLFGTSQQVTSTSPTLISATATSSGAGAVVGGYQVGVNNLAGSAQRTFAFTSPSAADTVTIDGQSVSLSAGAAPQDLANAVNANNKMDVWAAVTSSGNLVFSDRATGQQTGSYIQVSDTAGALTEQPLLANAGQNASYTLNNNTYTSASNTVTNAIPGVTMTFNGVTPTGAPATINVAPPAVSSSNIETALNTFVSQYNKVIGDIQTQLSTQPTSSDPTVGTLYNDSELSNLLTSMRSMMYTPGGGLPTGMATMIDIGVSTGATTGTGAESQSALAGDLTLNTSTFESALQSNPSGVQSVLNSWSINFSNLVNNEAAPGASIDQRIQADNMQVTQLGGQISSMKSALTDKQNMLVQQFAQLESALSTNQSTASWLTSQIASLPGA
ncbi:MAG TPA: flagellar filament capping protein FliD [Solirubrobacteraceae bacterium]|jgi:flagellar hook-associated protein 2